MHSPAQDSVLNQTMLWQLVYTSQCQDRKLKSSSLKEDTNLFLGTKWTLGIARACHWNFGCWEVWALLWKFWSHDLHSTESTGKSLCGMEKKSGDTRNFTKVWGKKWLTVPVDIKALGLLRFFWPEVNFGLWYLFVSFYGLSMKNGEGEGKSERSVGKEEDRGRELGGAGP